MLIYFLFLFVYSILVDDLLSICLYMFNFSLRIVVSFITIR